MGAQRGLVVGLAFGAVLFASMPASALTTIGADLNRPANAAFGCEALASTDAFGGRLFLPSGAQTCTYLGSGSISDQREVPGAPATGVVVRARVKVGPVTGPMQITVLRATRSGIGFACCFHAGETPPFVPAANAVTTLNVRLPVRFDLNPAFGETRDYVGLTVLAPGVPIPAHEEGAPGRFGAPLAASWFPHVRPGDERVDSAGVAGVVPLVQADVVPLCTGGLAALAEHGGACLRAVTLAGRTAPVRRGVATVSLVCNRSTTCQGTLRIQSAAAVGKARPTTFGTRRFQLGPGATRALAVALNANGRRLLRGRRTAYVSANVRLGGPVVAALRVRLTR